MKTLAGTVLFSSFLSTLAPFGSGAAPVPGDTEIESILRARIDQAKQSPAIVVGIIDEAGSRIIGYGKLETGQARPNGNTIFEIGSATKVFTALLLADMVERGEVSLDAPISQYLPRSVQVPTRNGRQITLLDLATHTSGLPRLPDNFSPKNPEDPYADYSVEAMYAFLSGYTLPRDIGAEYEYSNLAVGLEGHILALKAGTSYEALVLQRICRPLGMTNTQITLSPELKTRLAAGHNSAGQPVANWDLPTLAGAGALRSTANDLLKFLAVNLGLVKSDLWPAMKATHTARHSAGSPDMDIGLGWHISKKYGAGLIWHNGGTGGYHSFLGFDPNQKRGIVVLANSARRIDDIGFHLLEPRHQLAQFQPAKERHTISLPPETLRRYVGQYELAPGVFFSLRLQTNHLMARLTGQSYTEIFPESETEFFYKVVNAQLSFVKSSDGKVKSLVLHQNGADQPASKISDEPAPEHQAIKLAPETLDAYVGEYQLAPGAVLTVRRDADRLLARLTGQSFLEIFPEAETKFFYRVVDAQLTFVKDAQGRVTGLVLHQGGKNQLATKIR